MLGGLHKMPVVGRTMCSVRRFHAFIACRSHSTVVTPCSSCAFTVDGKQTTDRANRTFTELSYHRFKGYTSLGNKEQKLKCTVGVRNFQCRFFHTASFIATANPANEERVSLNNKTSEYIDSADSSILDMLKDSFLLYEDFISPEEEDSILQEIEPYLNRLKYEFNHWDDAIHGFRETERKKWTQKNKAIIQRIRNLAFPEGVQQLAYVHILDIKKTGYIKPHVDAVRFCGNTIAGISLLSTAVMRLVHTDNKDQFADVLLKRRSLYIMRDAARYKFTHEVLAEDVSKFKGEVVPRDRRVSVICRNEPAPGDRNS